MGALVARPASGVPVSGALVDDGLEVVWPVRESQRMRSSPVPVEVVELPVPDLCRVG